MPVFGCLNIIEVTLTQKFLMATKLTFLKSLCNLEWFCTFIYSINFKSKKNKNKGNCTMFSQFTEAPCSILPKSSMANPQRKIYPRIFKIILKKIHFHRNVWSFPHANLEAMTQVFFVLRGWHWLVNFAQITQESSEMSKSTWTA